MNHSKGPEATRTDTELLAQFEGCTLPAERWHHAEHIRIAYLYLSKQPFPEALDRGYHETLTVAWLRLVQVILAEYGPAESSPAFLEQHPELSQRKSLRLFCSRDRILSARAKAEFVDLDLAPLPIRLRANTSAAT